MCKDCGCEVGNGKHFHFHEDGSFHAHEHASSALAPVKSVEVGERVLALNDQTAAENRKFFRDQGILVINLISSPGSGKTLLLEKTLEHFQATGACSVIVGDQVTDYDAQRLSGFGAPVKQIETHSSCHLSAEHIAASLSEVVSEETKLLFIENVGNLVCPTAFDLGETFTVALLSTPEGEDKPEKYPALFYDAKLILITKKDLEPHLGWDRSRCMQSIQRVQPGARILELSAQTGQGMDEWFQYLGDCIGL